jgi:response regulator RpfG family c-di-GMP phosphodiesterase
MSHKAEKKPTILLIENDDEARRLLIGTLRARGYQVFSAFDEQSAIEWLLTNQKINIDLILLNQVKISQQECMAAIAKITRQANLSEGIPSVIIADRYQTALEGTIEEINQNQYIIYLENAEQLFALLHQLCFDR